MTTHRRNRANLLAGFTLIEILIVIVIIGLLAGMTTTVVVSARRSVNNSVVTAQMAQLSIALEEYKNQFGEYPPDLSDPGAVTRHIKKRWPRYHVSYQVFLDQIATGCMISSGRYGADTILNSVDNLDDLDPRHIWKLGAPSEDGPSVGSYLSSLVFWLGGLPDAQGVPSGFFASPKSPLGVTSEDRPIRRPGRAQKEKPFYSFEKKFMEGFEYEGDPSSPEKVYYKLDRSSIGRDVVEYIPAYCQGGYPILYFRPSVSFGYGAKSLRLSPSGDEGDLVSCAVPYAEGVNPDNSDEAIWYEEKRFQLIHPGSDGLFGSDDNSWRVVPARINISPEDADNLTNFIDGGTLERLYD